MDNLLQIFMGLCVCVCVCVCVKLKNEMDLEVCNGHKWGGKIE
jgi:hypothetical protein